MGSQKIQKQVYKNKNIEEDFKKEIKEGTKNVQRGAHAQGGRTYTKRSVRTQGGACVHEEKGRACTKRRGVRAQRWACTKVKNMVNNGSQKGLKKELNI